MNSVVQGFDRLTERQRDCLRLVAQGYTSKQIAARLGGISYNTVDNHIAAALDTLNLASRAEAARGLVAHESPSARLASAAPPLAAPAAAGPVGAAAERPARRLVPPLGGALHSLSAERRVSAILTIAVLGFVVLIVLTLATVVLLMLLQ